MMNVQVLRSWNDVDRLAGEWSELVGRCAAPSIFVTWEWISAWRQAIDSSVSPYVITVRSSDGRLQGIAPLYVAELHVFPAIKCRMLRHMADVATGSEYPDLIVDESMQVDVAKQITDELGRRSAEWDFVWFHCVAGWSGAQRRLVESANRSGLLTRSRDCSFSTIDLPDDVAAFENTFSASRRQQMRRTLRKVQRLDGVEFVRCKSAEDLPEFLDALFDLHQRRWRSVGKDGCFVRKPVEQKFYRAFSKVALDNNWLATYAIRQHGVFKAVQHGYIHSNSFLQLQEGYDPDFQKGAGNALRLFVIRECIEAGVKEYDFLAGVSEHKRRWSGRVRHGYDILFGSRSMKSRLVFSIGIWPSGKYATQQGLVTGI